ncbi:MAG: hypothetical protein HY420_01540 [Candidatus Kerfeldbacteria bacterium]|nr:hypothetical protein [Candidatus Kerfeldbacteria bacterium]
MRYCSFFILEIGIIVMTPGTYDDREDESDAPDPADWPLGKPGRPCGLYPTPAGMVARAHPSRARRRRC